MQKRRPKHTLMNCLVAYHFKLLKSLSHNRILLWRKDRISFPHGTEWHSLGLFAWSVGVEIHQVDDSLPQKLVQSHQGTVHSDDVKRASLRVPLMNQRQIERRFFLPFGRDAFLHYGRGKLVFAHLHDGICVVCSIFALDPQVSCSEHCHLHTGGIPLLVTQRHSQLKSRFNRDEKLRFVRSILLDICLVSSVALAPVCNCLGDLISPAPHAWRILCTQRSGDAGIRSFFTLNY